MRWSAFLVGGLFCATAWAQTPTCNITSPASSATINGTAFLIAGSVTSALSAYSVEIIFDGDSQGIIWLSPGQENWSMTWNTNLRFDTPGYGWITANVRDATNATICTATNTGITINNAFRYTPSQIKLTSVTLANGTGGSGCTTTTWTGRARSLCMTGTNQAPTVSTYSTLRSMATPSSRSTAIQRR